MINAKQKKVLLVQYFGKDILSSKKKKQFNFSDFSNNTNLLVSSIPNIWFLGKPEP